MSGSDLTSNVRNSSSAPGHPCNASPLWATLDGQCAAGLRFLDPRVQALLSALLVFRLLPRGFSNRDLRAHLTPLLGLAPSSMTQGRMTYDLRRLRLHGLIERIPTTHRYQVTDFGFQTACLVTRAYTRVLRPARAEVLAPGTPAPGRLRTHFDRLDTAIGQLIEEAHLAA